MIEISRNSSTNVWKAYVDGGLYRFDEDLQALLEYLARYADDVRNEMYQ